MKLLKVYPQTSNGLSAPTGTKGPLNPRMSAQSPRKSPRISLRRSRPVRASDPWARAMTPVGRYPVDSLIRKSQSISLINQDQRVNSLPLMRNQGSSAKLRQGGGRGETRRRDADFHLLKYRYCQYALPRLGFPSSARAHRPRRLCSRSGDRRRPLRAAPPLDSRLACGVVKK